MAEKRGVMLSDWAAFAALVERWKEHKATKVLEWHARLPQAHAGWFCENLLQLSVLAADARGNVVTAFDLLSPGAREALVVLLSSATERFPAPLLARVAGGVAALRAVPQLRVIVEQSEAASGMQKKRVRDEADDEEQLWEEPRSQRRLRSPSLSLQEEEEEEEEEEEAVEMGAVNEPAAVVVEQAVAPTLPEGFAESLRSDVFSSARGKELSQSQRVFAFSLEQIQVLNRPVFAPQISEALSGASDEAMEVFFGACGSGVDAAVGSRAFSGLLEYVLLPRVLALAKTASRALLTCCCNCVKANARVAVSSLFAPIVIRNPGPAQCELVSRCLDDAARGDDSLFSQFASAFLGHASAFDWTEGTVTVVQKVLSTIVLSDDDCAKLLAQMQAQVATHRSSVKFAKLLLSVVSKFDANATSPATVDAARLLAGQLTSFLSKTILQKLG
jgi:hypothetical protein